MKEKVFYIVIAVLLLLNVGLLYKYNNIRKSFRSNNKDRVTLTLDEQLILLEDELETGSKGFHYSNKIRESLAKSNKLTLLYQFWGENCRKCQHMELTKWNEIKDSLHLYNNILDIKFVFRGLNGRDYLTITQQYELTNISYSEESYPILDGERNIHTPSILLMNENEVILDAYFSIYTKPERMEAFYNRVLKILNSMSD